jgi:DNA-directed RNA polymerase specialized sigma24 family protein
MAGAFRPKHQCEQATDVDFRRIFKDETNLLYGLALLLTANHGIAEGCISAAFQDCLNTRSVFREWSLSWSKRAVIRNAIRLVAPGRRNDRDAGRGCERARPETESMLAQAVLELEQFHRFALIMSVLEGYRDKECGILLNCTAQEVAKARSAALRQLASTVGSRPAAALLTNALETFSAQLLPFPSENSGTHGWEDVGAVVGNI